MSNYKMFYSLVLFLLGILLTILGFIEGVNFYAIIIGLFLVIFTFVKMVKYMKQKESFSRISKYKIFQTLIK